jgi:toxin YoeB
VKVQFTEDGWEDYLHWANNDAGILRRVNALIEDVRRSPFRGIGKPEPLKGDLAGFWSRRITGDHRLVYEVSGKGKAQCVTVLMCRFHY